MMKKQNEDMEVDEDGQLGKPCKAGEDVVLRLNLG